RCNVTAWSFVVFVLVAAGTTAAGMRVCAWRSRALARLAPRTAAAPTSIPSPALVWRELVDRLGSSIPGSPKDLPRLKRRLLWAGFRDPGTVRIFQGVRPVLAIVFGLLGAVVVWQAKLSTLIVPVAAMAGYMVPGQYL